jgi:hypothetical protein
MDGIGVAHWQCTDCRRRFVLTFQDPAAFLPVYLDPGVRSIEPRATGSVSRAPQALKNTAPPPALEFSCKCGRSIVAHSWMYGGTTSCPGCNTTIYMVLKYSMKRKVHVIVPEYPPVQAGAE